MLSGRIESKAACMSSEVMMVCLALVLLFSRIVIVLDVADSVDLSLQKPCWAGCIGCIINFSFMCQPYSRSSPLSR